MNIQQIWREGSGWAHDRATWKSICLLRIIEHNRISYIIEEDDNWGRKIWGCRKGVVFFIWAQERNSKRRTRGERNRPLCKYFARCGATEGLGSSPKSLLALVNDGIVRIWIAEICMPELSLMEGVGISESKAKWFLLGTLLILRPPASQEYNSIFLFKSPIKKKRGK